MQTNFGEVAIGYPGQLCGSARNQIRSYAAENLIVEGKAVSRGTNAQTQVKVLTDRTKFLGVALKSSKDIEINKIVDVLEEGAMYVTAVADVTAGDACYLYDANTFGKDANNGWKVGYWITTTVANGVGIIEILKV